jgi:predicted nucleic acid-binding protein
VTDLVIVDTDVLIDAGRGIGEAVTCLQQIEQQAALGVSVITEMELIVGCRNKAELRTVERFLSRFQIIKVSEVISDTGVDLLRQYRLSHGLLIADALIAATALTMDQPFVTKNQRDYLFISGLQVLPYPTPFAA